MGILGSIYKLFEVWPKIVSNIVTGIKNLHETIKNAGGDLIKGLWEGINDKWEWLKEKIFSFAKGITDNIKSFFGIHSPSTVFRDEVGKFMAQGIGIGFSNEMSNVAKDMSNSIPTDFEINSTITKSSDSNLLNLENITNAFVTAVKNLDAQIIIDKDVAGRFVIKSVNSDLGELYS